MPILLVFIILLFSFPTFALTCGEVPSCESLGFSNVDNPDCPTDGYLYCPFDKSYKKCVVKGGINCKDHTLKECPEGATDCTLCGKGKLTELAYKVDDCKEGYGAENAVSCAANACDGYTLSSCNTQSSICSDCLSGTTTKYKLDDCQEGYKLENGTCVAEVVATTCEVGDVYYLNRTCSSIDDFVKDDNNPPVGVVFYVTDGGAHGKIVNLKDLTVNATTKKFSMEDPYGAKGINTDKYIPFGLAETDIPGVVNILDIDASYDNPDFYTGKKNTENIVKASSTYSECLEGGSYYNEGTESANYNTYCVPTATLATFSFYPVEQAKDDPYLKAGNWYLPALGEVWLLFGLDTDSWTYTRSNIATVNATLTQLASTLGSQKAEKVANASVYTYWSSSENDNSDAWRFNPTNYRHVSRDATHFVRAMLEF